MEPPCRQGNSSPGTGGVCSEAPRRCVCRAGVLEAWTHPNLHSGVSPAEFCYLRAPPGPSSFLNRDRGGNPTAPRLASGHEKSGPFIPTLCFLSASQTLRLSPHDNLAFLVASCAGPCQGPLERLNNMYYLQCCCIRVGPRILE